MFFVFSLNFGNNAFFSIFAYEKRIKFTKNVFKFIECQEHWKGLTTPWGVKESYRDSLTAEYHFNFKRTG